MLLLKCLFIIRLCQCCLCTSKMSSITWICFETSFLPMKKAMPAVSCYLWEDIQVVGISRNSLKRVPISGIFMCPPLTNDEPCVTINRSTKYSATGSDRGAGMILISTRMTGFYQRVSEWWGDTDCVDWFSEVYLNSPKSLRSLLLLYKYTTHVAYIICF
jgi:hypothetical protein